MITATIRLVARLVFLLALVIWPLQSYAAVDGKYSGEYQGQKVSAVLETITTTLTGVLEVGSDKYLLRAEADKGAFHGQLNNIKNGKSLKLLIKPKDDNIEVEMSPQGADEKRFTLQRTE